MVSASPNTRTISRMPQLSYFESKTVHEDQWYVHAHTHIHTHTCIKPPIFLTLMGESFYKFQNLPTKATWPNSALLQLPWLQPQKLLSAPTRCWTWQLIPAFRLLHFPSQTPCLQIKVPWASLTMWWSWQTTSQNILKGTERVQIFQCQNMEHLHDCNHHPQ